MDKKHGFDRSKLDAPKLDKTEASKKISDLMLEREQQELEYLPKNRFENKSFSHAEFNKLWEKQKRKDEKKKKQTKEDRSMIKWDGISAANDAGMNGTVDFVGIDADYEDLYSKDDFNHSNFASKLDSGSESNPESDLELSEEESNNDYYEGHNKNKDDTMKRLKDLEDMRKKEDEEYDGLEFSSQKRKSVMDNPMNISSQFGKVIGDSKSAGITYSGNKKIGQRFSGSI